MKTAVSFFERTISSTPYFFGSGCIKIGIVYLLNVRVSCVFPSYQLQSDRSALGILRELLHGVPMSTLGMYDGDVFLRV
ncbi:MAG: hypothetical protein JNL32_02600 [Candidatus Kapabacteria bacterium]|nr:hypothetical protein [Candidatus Kapabacteria bacterium]